MTLLPWFGPYVMWGRPEVLGRPQMLASNLSRAAYLVIDLDEALNRVGRARGCD